MHEYLFCCSVTNEEEQWSIVSFAARFKEPIETLTNLYDATPVVKEAAEAYFHMKFKDFFILMFNELKIEEKESDRPTEENPEH